MRKQHGRHVFLIEFAELCDGVETCGNENKICKKSRQNTDLFVRAVAEEQRLKKPIFYCLKGLKNLQQLSDLCLKEKFMFPDHEIFGITSKTELHFPKTKINCDYTYGEIY